MKGALLLFFKAKFLEMELIFISMLLTVEMITCGIIKKFPKILHKDCHEFINTREW